MRSTLAAVLLTVLLLAFAAGSRDRVGDAEEYQKRNFIEIPTNPQRLADRIRPRVLEALTAAKGAKPDIVDDLALHLATLLRGCGLITVQEYEKSLPPGARIRKPAYEAKVLVDVQRLAREFEELVPHDNEDDQRELFRNLYEIGRIRPDDKMCVTEVSIEPKGFWLKATSVDARDVGAELLMDAMDDEGNRYWGGGLAQGAIVFNGPPTLPEKNARDEKKYLTAHAAFIVRTRSGVAYPVQFQSFFDPQTKRWWLVTATRHASTRATSRMPLIF